MSLWNAECSVAGNAEFPTGGPVSTGRDGRPVVCQGGPVCPRCSPNQATTNHRTRRLIRARWHPSGVTQNRPVGVTSKPASCRPSARTICFTLAAEFPQAERHRSGVSLMLSGSGCCLGPPTTRSTFEDMAVVEKTVEHGGDGCDVPK